MRVLVAAFGTRGDVFPMVSLASALRARGHAVQVCAPPDDEAWIRARGLPVEAVGPSMREFVGLSVAGPRGLWRAMRVMYPALLAEQFRALEPHARASDVMLGSTLTVAGPTFAERFGARYHYVAFAPVVLPSGDYPSLNVPWQAMPRWLNRLTWRANALANNLLVRSTINRERRRFGLAPVDDAWDHLLHRVVIGSEPALAPLPADAPPGVVQTGAWVEPSTEALDPDLERFLDGGPPPVYVGFGSMPDADPARTTRRLVAELSRVGHRALLFAGASGLGSAGLPAGVRGIGPTSHARLFPRCALVVHHGGAGTTATAARAGVPQLIVPHMTDQYFWRHRLTQLGLTPRARVAGTLGGLAKAVSAALGDDALAARAKAFAAGLVPDGLQRAIRLVETGAA